jgi:hypothetical protein
MPVVQTVNMSHTRTIQVFVSNHAFLASDVAVMLVAVIGVTPLFYGFWDLGRDVTLSPIETVMKSFINAYSLRRPVLSEGSWTSYRLTWH